MLLSELAGRISGARQLGSDDPEVSSLAYDSRKTSAGALFLALPGEKTDGAQFVEEAMQAGAVAVLSERAEQLCGLPQLVVDDARLAMAEAARAVLGDPSEGMRLLAVTGTNGKTTTAYLVRHILNQTIGKCGMTGTVEYDLGSGGRKAHMTTPESLDLYSFYAEMHKAGCDHAISEVSSHSLVKQRVAGINFSVGIFTNLTQDHLDYHGDMETYFRAKAMLFEGLSEAAVAVVNADDSYAAPLVEMTPARTVAYGLGEGAELRGEILNLSTVGTVFRMTSGSFEAEVHMGLLGAYNVYNALAAAGAAMELGVSPDDVVEALGSFEGVAGRLESIDCGQDFRVLVDYAHTDDALRSVLAGIRELYPRRVITVFGCGGDRDRTKRPRMGLAAEELSEVVVVTSDNPRSEDPEAIIHDILEGLANGDQAIVVPDRSEAIVRAIGMAEKGDVVLIAGKGHETCQIMGTERVDLDDRKVARSALMAHRDTGGQGA